MTYSRWNWNTGKFDYYEAEGDQLGNRPRSRVVLNQPKSTHGVPVEAVLPIVPAGARQTGSGTVARGRVAVLSSEVMSPQGQSGGVVDASMGLGFGGVGLGLEDNPLMNSPWLTLGLWMGAFFLGAKIINLIAGPKR